MTTTTHHLDTVKDFLANGRIGRRSIGSGYTVLIEKDSSGITLRKGSDGKWRYTYHTTYGNGSFVNGEGCDASGYVITDSDTIDALEAIVV